MSFKTVVAYSRSEAEMRQVLSAVGLLLRQFVDLHVIGLYVHPSPLIYADPNGFIDPGLFEIHDKQHREQSARLRHMFEQDMQRHNANFEFRVINSDTGTQADGVLSVCLSAELLVMAQPDFSDPESDGDTVDTLIFNASCPVLLVPHTPVLPMVSLERIAIAYNGKCEAARAAFDALSFVEKSRKAEIIWIDPPVNEDEDQALSGSDLAESLSRHGVSVGVSTLSSHDRYAQDVLREHIIAERINLLVMGAYSRSRLYELLFGGVTRSMLNDLPVLTLFSR